MNELGNYLSDVLRLTIGISVGASFWLIRSPERLRIRLLDSLLEVTARRSLPLKELLEESSRNLAILQSYFVDLNLLIAGRLLGAGVLIIIWASLVSWLSGRDVREETIFIVVAVGDLFLILATLLVVHRREKIKDI